MPFEGRSPFAAIADALEADWRAIARPEQLPPPGDWTIWLYLGGRGAGKTRAGAEAVREWIETGICRRVALIAPTQGDARDVMVEGEVRHTCHFAKTRLARFSSRQNDA